MSHFTDKLLNFLSSLKLAVFVILSLAVISGVGTIYEARFDAEYAQKVVYHSPYMYGVLLLLCVNLIFVMIDRWPWRPHHAGFILAHIGIITTLVGSYITKEFGVDGSISFPIGEASQHVVVPTRELVIYSSFSGGTPALMYNQEVDFFSRPPEEESLVVGLGTDQFKVTKYYHYALRNDKFKVSDKVATGPAVRFQLQNKNVNLINWIHKTHQKEFESLVLGPAQVVLDDGSYKYKGGNVIVFTPRGEELDYKVYLQRQGGLIKSGRSPAGAAFETGWMDLTMRILNYMPKAQQEITYQSIERPSALATSAIEVDFKGETYWVGLNSVVKLFAKDKVYYLLYRNRRLDLGFNLKLVDFRVGRYQGTRQAKTYESDVQVEGNGKVTISMNEPLKHKGFTFYQASFEEDEMGRPVLSILSVNKDPGRFIKYLGSFLIVLGAVILFYFKRVRFVKARVS